MSIGLLAALAVPSLRAAALRGAGSMLLASDPLQRADVGVLTEFGEGNELEIADLYREQMFSRVVLLEPSPTAVDREYLRRGVFRDDVIVSTLRQLGVPENAIVHVDAGEAGTTESTHALIDWIRMHPSRAIVVVIPSHARRFRRTLLRAWPAAAPPPIVRTPRYNAFRPEDWWTTRRTLRDGVFELEKLGFDYLLHPF